MLYPRLYSHASKEGRFTSDQFIFLLPTIPTMMSYVDDRPFLFRKYVNIDTVLLCRKLSIPAPIFFSHHLLAKSIQSTPLLIYFEVTNTYCCPAKKSLFLRLIFFHHLLSYISTVPTLSPTPDFTLRLHFLSQFALSNCYLWKLLLLVRPRGRVGGRRGVEWKMVRPHLLWRVQ